MASGPITSGQIDGETVGTVTDFIFWVPKSLQMVTSAMKLRHLLLERKVVTNLDSLLKSRDITLPTKVHLFKAVVFPVVMYEEEIWTIKKAERQRIDAFELWCWRKLLRVLWTARRSHQSIPKEINSEYSLEGLRLKLQYFGHVMRRASSLEKTLMLSFHSQPCSHLGSDSRTCLLWAVCSQPLHLPAQGHFPAQAFATYCPFRLYP